MSRLTRDGTAETVSRDQILRRGQGQGNSHFPCSADHEQDWQPYPVDPYSCYMCDHTYSWLKMGRLNTSGDPGHSGLSEGGEELKRKNNVAALTLGIHILYNSKIVALARRGVAFLV